MLAERHLYCVKCHAGKTVVGVAPVKLKNGSMALRGTCPTCQGSAYKIVGNKFFADAMKPRSEKSASQQGLTWVNAALLIGCGAILGVLIAYLR